jgi:mono/diheme cytochrome c family protein
MKGDERSLWRGEAIGLANRYAIPLGVVILFVLFGLIVVPAILRERQPLPRPPSDQPAAPGMGWLDQADAPPSKGRDLPPVDPKTVMTANPKLLARGEALFKQQCTSCHGDSGHGNGPAAATLNPKPRDFTQSNGWQRGYHITDIFQTISGGIKGTGMAAFDFLLPSDRMALVHYVRSLGSFDHGAEDPAKLAALANQFRTQAVHIPNRIPVRMAIAKLVAEWKPVPPLALPAADDHSQTATLLRLVVADPARAARTVAATRREDRDVVVRAWVAGAPGNGFATVLADLREDEWREVTGALLGNDRPAEASSQRETKR